MQDIPKVTSETIMTGQGLLSIIYNRNGDIFFYGSLKCTFHDTCRKFQEMTKYLPFSIVPIAIIPQ